MSAFEYSVSQLKYFNEEEERMNYINPMYHPEIKLKNYTALVSEIIDELIKKDSGVEYMLKNKQLNLNSDKNVTVTGEGKKKKVKSKKDKDKDKLKDKKL